MNLGELRSLGKVLYYSITSKKDVDDVQWNALLNVSNRALWLEVTGQGGSRFIVQSPDQNTTTGTFDISTLSPAIHELNLVEWKTTTGEYVPLDYLVYHDRAQFNLGIGLTAMDPSGYTLVDNTLSLLPLTTGSTTTFRLIYVPTLADMSADTDVPLSGAMPMFDSLVAFDATIALLSPTLSLSLNKIADRMRTSLNKYLSSRQRSARVIRSVNE